MYKIPFLFLQDSYILFSIHSCEFCLEANNKVIWGLCSQNSSRLFWESKRLVQYHGKKNKIGSFNSIKPCYYLSYPGYFLNNMPWFGKDNHFIVLLLFPLYSFPFFNFLFQLTLNIIFFSKDKGKDGEINFISFSLPNSTLVVWLENRNMCLLLLMYVFKFYSAISVYKNQITTFLVTKYWQYCLYADAGRRSGTDYILTFRNK